MLAEVCPDTTPQHPYPKAPLPLPQVSVVIPPVLSRSTGWLGKLNQQDPTKIGVFLLPSTSVHTLVTFGAFNWAVDDRRVGYLGLGYPARDQGPQAGPDQWLIQGSGAGPPIEPRGMAPSAAKASGAWVSPLITLQVGAKMPC